MSGLTAARCSRTRSLSLRPSRLAVGTWIGTTPVLRRRSAAPLALPRWPTETSMPASRAPTAKSASRVSAPPQVSESIRTCMRSLRSATGARPGTGRGSGRTVAWIEVLSWRPNAPGGDRKRPQGWALALRRTALRGPRGTRARGRLDHRQGARARPHPGRHPGEGRIATSGPQPRRGTHGLRSLLRRAVVATRVVAASVRTVYEVARGGYDIVLLADDLSVAPLAAGALALTTIPGGPPVAAVCHEPRPRTRRGGNSMWSRGRC